MLNSQTPFLSRWIFIGLAVALQGCGKENTVGQATVTSAQNEPSVVSSVALTTASTSDCPQGGVLIRTYQDVNNNGAFDAVADITLSVYPVCNGSNGVSTGVQVVNAGTAACPAGGLKIETFLDANSNGSYDAPETVLSSSTVCNGINGTNGTNGTSSVITAHPASTAQCASGGVVYTTVTTGQPPTESTICNGSSATQNGFANRAVGPVVPGRPFTACHHDAIYIPDTSGANRGWLIFRHQANGTADQGSGTTGFNLWAVDIASFVLQSETSPAQVYCSASWNAATKQLQFTVIETAFGFQGQTGTIQF